MKQSEFPKGWDEAKAKKLLDAYEKQTDEEAVAEDEAAIQPSEAVMSVPYDLVPQIRELIAKNRH